MDRYNYWRDMTPNGCPQKPDCKAGVDLLVTNIPVPIALQCQDLVPDWKDRTGRSCANYTDATMPLCNMKGLPTEAWTGQNLYDDEGRNEAENEDDQLASPVVCCGCGGGSLGGNRTAFPSYMDPLNVE